MSAFRIIRAVPAPSGGFLETHAGRELGTDRTVLLSKVLERREGLDVQLSDRLKQLRVASLPKTEVQKNADGVWVVTEATEGESLRWVMRTLAKQSGFIAPNEGLAVVARVAQTLDGLHRAGLAHGDICPSTIWVTQQGDVVLRDAGIAAVLGLQGDLGPFRSELHSVAPEQITGTPGAPADVFRLGLLLYELAVGKPLWPGPTPAHVCHAAVSWQGLQREQVKNVPEPWLTLLVTMLQLDPDARPVMEEVTAILDQALKQNRWSATQNSMKATSSRRCWKDGSRACATPGGSSTITARVSTR